MGTVKALGQILVHSVCAVREKMGNVPWQSLGISSPFLDSHKLLFTSIFIRGSANPKTQVAVLFFFNL